MNGVVAYALSKKYTDDTVVGMGAIKGAPCEVQSINKVGKITTITLKWEDTTGTTHTQSFNVEDGLDGLNGVSVVGATINSTGNLILTLSDTNTIDCGKVLPQYDTMPVASASNEGQVLQYIGTTNINYTKGYYYQCINDNDVYKWVNIKVQNAEDIFRYNILPTPDSSIEGTIVQYIGVNTANYTNGYYYQCVEAPVGSGTYAWVQKNVQPNNGGGGGDDVIDGYYNTVDHKFYEEPTYINEITGEVGKIYISDDTNIQYRWNGIQFVVISSSVVVDNELSTTSENPVQNKVIALKINQLEGSILNKQAKLTKGDGIDINSATNTISLDMSYLTASRVGYIPNVEKGEPDGIAELDTHGKVPSSQLPSYIDDVIDGYYYDETHFYKEKGRAGYYNTSDNQFYEESTYTTLIVPVTNDYYLDISTSNTYQYNGTAYIAATPTRIVGEGGVIYISVDSNIQYRWTGTAFAALGGALQLGETSTTAYRGDRGKVAYDHSQIKDGSNPHKTTADNINLKVPISALSGSKLDVESTLHGVDTVLDEKQNIQLSVPIQTLSGSQLTVETALGGINDDVVKTFTGTQAQWDALSLADKQKYEICNITDDGSTDNVYTVGEVDALLDEKLSYADNGVLGAKNLIPYPYYNVTPRETNGITYTYTDDGIVNANGTAIADALIAIAYNIELNDFDKCILSGCPEGGGSGTYHIYACRTENPYTHYADDYGNGAVINCPSSQNGQIVIRIKSGVTVSNLKFKPMIRIASDTDETYQPYAMTNRELTKLTKLKTYVTPNIGARFYKVGRICYVSFESAVTDKAYVDGDTMDTIPEEFRPIYSSSFLDTLGTSHSRMIIADNIFAKGNFDAGQNIRGYVTYITNN